MSPPKATRVVHPNPQDPTNSGASKTQVPMPYPNQWEPVIVRPWPPRPKNRPEDCPGDSLKKLMDNMKLPRKEPNPLLDANDASKVRKAIMSSLEPITPSITLPVFPTIEIPGLAVDDINIEEPLSKLKGYDAEGEIEKIIAKYSERPSMISKITSAFRRLFHRNKA